MKVFVPMLVALLVACTTVILTAERPETLRISIAQPAERLTGNLEVLELEGDLAALAPEYLDADVLIFEQTGLLSACNRARDCAEAIERACTAVNQEVERVEFRKSEGHCSGSCADGRTVSVTCVRG